MTIQYRSELHKLLPNLSKSWIAEIGVAEGHFSKDMLDWGIQRLYMVDIWKTYGKAGDNSFPQEWHDKNLQGVKEKTKSYLEQHKAIILQGFSTDMAQYVPDHCLDMVYLDGGHDYASVMADLIVWREKVKIGGIIAGHDYNDMPDYGVKNAVTDYFYKLNKFKSEVNVIPDIDESHQGFWFVNELVEEE